MEKRGKRIWIILLCLVMLVSLLPATSFARDRDIFPVESNNSLNMSMSDSGILTWDSVPNATGYRVSAVMPNGLEAASWDVNNPFLAIEEIDGSKIDSGQYTLSVYAKGTDIRVSMPYYYTSNVDKLEAPHNLKWIGNTATWDYVEGASGYSISLYDFNGRVINNMVNESPVDFTDYSPQDGWTFKVQALSNGTLNDKRHSDYTESPAKGSRTGGITPVASDNSLNMCISDEVLSWDEVQGATGYLVSLKQPPSAITLYSERVTSNTFLALSPVLNGLKLESKQYSVTVEAEGVSGKKASVDFYYTSHVDQLEPPQGLKWADNTAMWTEVDGAAYYNVTLYDYEGAVTSDPIPTYNTWYDFLGNDPQDGCTFRVQACSNGTINDKRNSYSSESPAKETTYSIVCVSYDQSDIQNDQSGTISLETNKDSEDFSTSVSGIATQNTEVTIKAEANPGYEFVAWRITYPLNPEATLTTDATYTFKATSNLHLFAVFQKIPDKYRVEYNGNDASGLMADEIVDAGGAYTLKECTFLTPSGKDFMGWAVGSIDATPLKQPGDEITINTDTTIYAVWETLYITEQPKDTSGKIGTEIKLPVGINLSEVPDVDAAYIVLEVQNGINWEKVAESKRSEWIALYGGLSVSANSTCTKDYRYKIYNGAEWIESDSFTVEFLPLEVTFVDNTHATITESIYVDTCGSVISKPDDPVCPGDTFDCWWNNGEWNFETRTVTQDITLFASWFGYGFYGDIPDVYAKIGDKAKIDLANVNYDNTFTYLYKYDGANWTQVENVTNYGLYNLPASNIAKTEIYKIVIGETESNEFKVMCSEPFTVAFNANGGSDTMDSAKHFGPYVLPECSFDKPVGKQFKAWAIGNVNGEQMQPGQTIIITADTILYAIWEDAAPVSFERNGKTCKVTLDQQNIEYKVLVAGFDGGKMVSSEFLSSQNKTVTFTAENVTVFFLHNTSYAPLQGVMESTVN